MIRLIKRLSLCFLWSLLVVLLLGAGIATWVLWDLPEVGTLADRSTTLTIEVPDWQGDMHPLLVGPKNAYWTPLERLPGDLEWAVIVAEDANFYDHRGIDVPALKEALKYDLKRKRLARGASTITQQLAKNLFLSRDKSVRRKLREVVIAWELEKALSKGRILELYLNVVELGPLVYGVGHGARYHFDKSATDLTSAESAFLAAMLPGPRVAFNPQTRLQKVRQRAERLLRLLLLRKVISENELAANLAELNTLTSLGGRPRPLPEPQEPPWDEE